MAGGAAQAASPHPPRSAPRSAPGSPAAAAASARGSGSSGGAASPCGAERRAGVGTALRPALQSPALPARMLGRPPPPSAPAPAAAPAPPRRRLFPLPWKQIGGRGGRSRASAAPRRVCGRGRGRGSRFTQAGVGATDRAAGRKLSVSMPFLSRFRVLHLSRA
ncbi:sterile alpha motif domain-containing protein 1-like [Mustela nigripes]|uniref:sterile alpha motif domain-containing protein 1-like n=1 Tax=Mustela nigripes TaxID=77151 RepID=UPI002814B479|nr:sterile alpha motif domain-containing protein 1-like [Mustela nigripes]XP_059260399.1 sterile alpha motif domain-containing protein 1-like [Mustela nigripes]XP_059260400.1 sterile alpha motif domain-containing protein 1-like [Mustela nigripes]XP_059260401.1 sterile alpha motif domain-containing protein 1-like [Mustela nigripes]XP_059260402.1 sterile alpha motif domain-containing protein 1-like [Mustela nigripes]XP_059260403.1 sterile alpha motif domain-containing protein 1-like [Mustela nig